LAGSCERARRPTSRNGAGTSNVPGKPGGGSGSGSDLDDCKAQFRAPWATIRAGLADADIARADRYAEASAEALALYDRKGWK
jgi:hypothetical protein